MKVKIYIPKWNDNFQYSYPHSNALWIFFVCLNCVVCDRKQPKWKMLANDKRYYVWDDIEFLTVYCRIYCHKLFFDFIQSDFALYSQVH